MKAVIDSGAVVIDRWRIIDLKRGALSLLAGLLLLGLVPGSALATDPTSNLDQSAVTGAISTGGNPLAQTFTAGRGGLLSGVDLNLAISGTTIVNVSLQGVHNVAGQMVPDGVQHATKSASVTGASWAPNWVHFSFSSTPVVASGTMYAIVFDPGIAGAYGGAADVYAGGEAWAKPQQGWIPFASLSDFGFRTYVDNVGTQLNWDKAQITGGTSTPLTLTATMTYANGVEANHYGAFLGLVPTWFTPSGITCSDTASKIVPADCTLLNFGNGFSSLIPASASGDILTFTVTGTANPALSDIGTAGMAGANACINYPSELTYCGDATASVAVVVVPPTPAPPTPAPPTSAPPTAAPTPAESVAGATASPTKAATLPPTNTGVGSSSDESGSTILLLPVALISFFGGLLVLDIRRRRLIS